MADEPKSLVKEPYNDYSIDVPELRLVYQDLFVFKPLYRVTHKYFCENGWKDYAGNEGENALLYETYYLHRETGGGRYDVNVVWDWYKPYPNDNYTMNIKMEFMLLGGIVEERRIGDRKVKGESGELTIFFRPKVLIKDEGFNTNPFLARVKRRFFEKDTQEIAEQVQAYTYSKTKEVYDLLKTYLDSHGSVFGMDTLIHRKWEGV